MASDLSIQKTVYKVSDFLGWQRDGTLLLSPSFQRRPVWKPIAKSFLIDTLVRGFPIPVIFIRERVDLDSQTTVREVVDGQQRLRTILSFVDSSSLTDFDPRRDEFTVRTTHNSDIAGRPFARLPAEARSAILGYEFSTHILSSATEDRDILQMFSRINSTGTKLNAQEIRNAEFFGEFKTLMYRLALEQLERWREWGTFTEDQIARMKEVELTSDIVVCMLAGLVAKRQPTLKVYYDRYDETFGEAEEVSKRFQRIFDELDETLGGSLANSAFTSEVWFYTLTMVFYDLIYGLNSPLSSRKARPLARGIGTTVLAASERIEADNLPEPVLDAARRAPVDAARRRVRHDYLLAQLGASTRH